MYEANCATATCHRGDGSGNLPSIQPSVGAVFQARNPTAQVVFDVVRSGEEPNLLALSDQQVYDAIAWELALNGVDLQGQELTAANAAAVATGPAAAPQPGAVYPPLDVVPPGAAPISPAPFLTPPAGALALAGRSGANGRVALRVGQIGYVDRLGGTSAPPGSALAVVALAVGARLPAQVPTDPAFLRGVDRAGTIHPISATRVPSAIDNFHARLLLPGRGHAGVVAFEIPAGSALAALVYDDGQAPPLWLTSSE